MSADQALRWSLGLVYVWFGILKVFELSPVDSLIQRFYAPMVSIPFYCVLTAFEVLVGILLVIGWKKKLTALLVMGHLLGTMCILISAPEIAYEPFAPILSMEGEFVAKNVVLLGAAYAIFAGGWKLKRRTRWAEIT